MSIILSLCLIPLLSIFLIQILPRYTWGTLKVTVLLIWLEFIVQVLTLYPLLVNKITPIPVFDGFMVDKIAILFILLTTLIMAACFSHSYWFFSHEFKKNNSISLSQLRIFNVISIMFYLSMIFVYCLDNLGYLWIDIELTTILSAGLVYFNRTKHALEATWKYFVICSVGIAFALLGTTLIYASSQLHGCHGSLNVSYLINQTQHLDLNLFKFGFIFCLLGYGTKAGIFPLHSWLPDAHSEAPAPASAMLSACLLNCALFAILRLNSIACLIIANMASLIIWIGCITILAASLFLLRQYGIKRLWAYSSIENVGLMLVSIGLNQPWLFFLLAFNHSLVKSALFLLSGNIMQITNSKELKDISGLIEFSPVMAILLVLSSLAITGTPPFGNFMAEIILLSQLLNLNFIYPFILIAIALTISFIAVLTHVGKITVGKPKINYIQLNNFNYSLIPVLLVFLSLIAGFFFTNKLFIGMN